MKTLEKVHVFTDKRDGQKYGWLMLADKKKWMVDNLNYETSTGSWYYDDDPTNGPVFGRLYTSQVAMDEACPKGWRLPTIEEVIGLFRAYDPDYIGPSIVVYDTLIEGGSSGFNAVLGGNRHPEGEGSYVGKNIGGYYWAQPENSTQRGFVFSSIFNHVKSVIEDSPNHGYSIRCIKSK